MDCPFGNLPISSEELAYEYIKEFYSYELMIKPRLFVDLLVWGSYWVAVALLFIDPLAYFTPAIISFLFGVTMIWFREDIYEVMWEYGRYQHP